MKAQTVLEQQWPYLLSFLPSELDLDTSASESGALVRKRGVQSAEALLRLALVYGFCGLPLRQTAAWAEMAGVAHLSDVALLNRLRTAAPWLGQILGAKLADRAAACCLSGLELQARIVDATTISALGSRGTDWRVHLGFDLRRMAIDHVEVTGPRGGETFRRFEVRPRELLIADRGYAHRQGMAAVQRAEAFFLVRLNWQNVPLQHRDGSVFEILPTLRKIPEAAVVEFAVQTAATKSLPAMASRLVAVRKSEAAANESRKKTLRERRRKGRTVDPRTLEASSYVFVLTSLPDGFLSGAEILELYRFRWQIEIAFKRLKGLLDLDDLNMKDPDLVRTVLYSKLLAALLLDDFSERFLSFSPWGFPLRAPRPQPVAHSAGSD